MISLRQKTFRVLLFEEKMCLVRKKLLMEKVVASTECRWHRFCRQLEQPLRARSWPRLCQGFVLISLRHIAVALITRWHGQGAPMLQAGVGAARHRCPLKLTLKTCRHIIAGTYSLIFNPPPCSHVKEPVSRHSQRCHLCALSY